MFKRSISLCATGEHMALDLITNLPPSADDGYTTLLLLIDVASHFMVGMPLHSMQGPVISQALKIIFNILPTPKYLSCDHQTSFGAINEFCKEYHIFCVKSTPSAKNELGSIDSACRIVTQYLQKVTTSLDQQLRLQWPHYMRILFDNINSRYSNRNKFTRSENFFGPLRFLPNHRNFGSDIFDMANTMLSEVKATQQRKLTESERRSHNTGLLELSFPRNSIVRLHLSKSEKPTISGSRKLIPDTPSFFRVLRSGPSNCQIQNISDNSIRTIKKTALTLVNYEESQTALQLIRENFPKSLLWEANQPHMKTSAPTYIHYSETKESRQRTVTFNDSIQVMYIGNLVKLEDEFIQRFKFFSQFSEFLREKQTFPVEYEPLKSEVSQYRQSTAIHNFFGCPGTTGKELELLLK